MYILIHMPHAGHDDDLVAVGQGVGILIHMPHAGHDRREGKADG